MNTQTQASRTWLGQVMDAESDTSGAISILFPDGSLIYVAPLEYFTLFAKQFTDPVARARQPFPESRGKWKRRLFEVGDDTVIAVWIQTHLEEDPKE